MNTYQMDMVVDGVLDCLFNDDPEYHRQNLPELVDKINNEIKPQLTQLILKQTEDIKMFVTVHSCGELAQNSAELKQMAIKLNTLTSTMRNINRINNELD